MATRRSWSSIGTERATTPRPPDPEAVKELERAGWSSRAGTYGCLTGQITARLVEPLLDAASIEPGMRVLDVGTGPGYAARQAAERGALATGVDIAEELLELARGPNDGIRFLHGDAEDLPFAARSFDALVCNFTINHVPRPERAIAEFARVLVPGGWVAVSTWDTPDRNRCLGILADAVRECGVTARPADPDPYRFADDDELRRLLRGERLEEVEVRSLSLAHRIEAEELWQGLLGGSVRTAGLVEQQTARTRRRIRTAADRLAEEYRDGGELAIPVSAKIARGRKP